MYLSKIGEPQGLAKNIRLCVCPAERDRTFEGVPIIDGGGEEVEGTKKIPLMQGFVGFFCVRGKICVTLSSLSLSPEHHRRWRQHTKHNYMRRASEQETMEGKCRNRVLWCVVVRPYVYKKKNRWPVTVSGEIK